MLSKNWKNHKEKHPKIIGPNGENANDSLEILCTIMSLTGQLPLIDINNYKKYYEYANYFMVENLIQQCDQFVSKNINANTITEFLALGWRFTSTNNLYKYCSDYIRLNIQNICQNDLHFFDKLANLDDDLLSNFLADPHFNFHSEENKYLFLNNFVTSLKKKYNAKSIKVLQISSPFKKLID